MLLLPVRPRDALTARVGAVLRDRDDEDADCDSDDDWERAVEEGRAACGGSVHAWSHSEASSGAEDEAVRDDRRASELS